MTDNGIAQSLLFRSLTTFRQNEDGAYELVPDLATDLGTPNEDFTEWTFTLKDGIKWENGDPVTAEEVAFGIKRSFDGDTFATGPGTSYSKPYFEGGDKYNGPYADGDEFPGVEVDGNDIIMKFSTPFAEMDYYSIFPAIGPVPLDAEPDRLRPRAAVDRSLQDREVRPEPGAGPGARTTSGTRTLTRPVVSWSTSTPSSSTSTRRSRARPCSATRAHDGRDRAAVHGLQQGARRTASTTRSSSARSRAPAS